MNIYRISQEMNRIEWMLDASEGEMTPEIEAAMDAIKNEVVNQPDFFGGWLKNLRGNKEELKEACQYMSEKKSRRENMYKKVQKLIVDAMTLVGTLAVKGKNFKIAVRETWTTSYEWIGKGEIPKEYQKVFVEISIDKDKIRELDEAGKLPKGFQKVEKCSKWIQVT